MLKHPVKDPTPSARRAFTLIELLVVVSLIALLIAILMPALSSARDHMQLSAGAKNQMELGRANFSYAAGNDGQVTPSMYGVGSPYNFAGTSTPWIKGGFANPGGAEGTWIGMGLLYSEDFISSGEVLYDPANEHQGSNYSLQYDDPLVGFRDGKPWESGNRWMNNTYIQRASIGAQNNNITNVKANPGSGTGRQVSIEEDNSGVAFITCLNSFDGSRSHVEWTHKTGYNVTYVDGAVEFVELEGADGQTEDPSIIGSEDMTIPDYIKAMGISGYKYKPKEFEKMFYYKLDKHNPNIAPAP